MFTNVRVRLQRLTDLKFFNGWVSNFVGKDIYIRFGDPVELEPGSSFYVTVSGYDLTAQFTAVVYREFGEEILFSIGSGITYSESKEDVRYSVSGVNGIIVDEGSEYGFEIADISRKGFGGFVHGNIAKNKEVKFRVDSSFGEINGEAEVKYCRPDQRLVNRNRIGLAITHIGRIDSARWQKLLGENSSF